MCKMLLEGYVEHHSSKLHVPDQTAVFNELGVKTCWLSITV